MLPAFENLTDPIWHWAAQRPHAPAFHEGPVTLTYGELAPLVGRAAVYLDRLGIRAGDRVAISLTNSIDHFVLLLGLLRLGAAPLGAAPPKNSALTTAAAEELCTSPRIGPRSPSSTATSAQARRPMAEQGR